MHGIWEYDNLNVASLSSTTNFTLYYTLSKTVSEASGQPSTGEGLCSKNVLSGKIGGGLSSTWERCCLPPFSTILEGACGVPPDPIKRTNKNIIHLRSSSERGRSCQKIEFRNEIKFVEETDDS